MEKLFVFGLVFICSLSLQGVEGKPWKIIGGQPAVKNEFPYQITLRRNGRHICGGAIVSEGAVLTAAHCVQIGAIGEFLVLAGEHSLNFEDGTEQERNVSKVTLHPEYDAWTVFNDLALVHVSPPFTLNGAVKSVRLAPEGHDAQGIGLVSGWGYTDQETEKLSDILQKVGVPLVSDQVCKDAYDPMDITESMLCAGFPTGGIDVCGGDAGDPLVCYDGPEPYLCGIFSWQHTNCGEPNYPSVYSEVAYFTNWIAQNLN